MAQTQKIQIPNDRFNSGIHDFQLDVMREFDRGRRLFYLRWHRKSRKTTLAINLLIREAILNPKSVYDYVGPTYKQSKGIIWRDPNMLFSYLPPEHIDAVGWEKNESELFIRFRNGSLIQVKGGDDPDSLRGPDVRGVVLDEWALMKLEIWHEIYRPIIAQGGGRWSMFIFTPKGMNHAFEMEQFAKASKDWYTSALPASKSGLIPEDELIKARAELPTAIYDQEFEVSYITDEERVLISSRMLEDLGIYPERPHQKHCRVIACDPSMGGDECVIYAGEDYDIIGEKILHERNTMVIVGEIAIMCEKWGTNEVVVDVIGLGQGIADRLDEIGKNVHRFNSAEKAIDFSHFTNCRSEAWWLTMKAVETHTPNVIQDLELRRQLSAVRYKTVDSNGKIKLDPKDDTKKLLGRSPDRADTYVMMVWAMTQVDPIDPRQVSDKYDFSFDPMAA